MFLKGYFSNRWKIHRRIDLAKRGDSFRELLSIKNQNLLFRKIFDRSREYVARVEEERGESIH